MDRNIRSFIEITTEEDFDEKRFVIKTYGACQSNGKQMVLEANLDKNMWKHGVGKITIGDESAFFDINEMLNYLRVCVQ